MAAGAELRRLAAGVELHLLATGAELRLLAAGAELRLLAAGAELRLSGPTPHVFLDLLKTCACSYFFSDRTKPLCVLHTP